MEAGASYLQRTYNAQTEFSRNCFSEFSSGSNITANVRQNAWSFSDDEQNEAHKVQKEVDRRTKFPLTKFRECCIGLILGGLLAGMILAVAVTMWIRSASVDTTKTTVTISTTTQTTSTSTSSTSATSSTTSTSTSTTTSVTTTTTSTSTSTTTSVTTTTTTSASTTTTTTVALYWVSSPVTNLNPLTLSTAGWTECYNSTYAVYMTPSEVATALSQCNKNKLLMACKQTSASVYALAAMGLREDVLFNCSTISACTNVANGVGWYYSDVYSWGFVNGTDTVVRSSCDTGTSNPTLRLCWHTSSTYGGYRCGSTLALNSDTSWQRSVWHAN